MSTLDDKYAFRAEMVDRLHADLIGPAGGPEEVLDEDPLDRYIVGVLWPSTEQPQAETAEEPLDEEADDADDTPVAQSLMRYPSSTGFSFSVEADRASNIQVDVSAARYEPVTSDGQDVADERRTRSRRKRGAISWRRVEVVVEPVVVDLASAGPRRSTVAPGLQLYVLVRPPVDGIVTVTAALVNINPMPAAGERDAAAWFQVGLEATTSKPAIVDRNRITRLPDDDDLASSALLYRNNRTFAAGHGCAATWPPTSEARVSVVNTSFLPRHELPRAKAVQFDVVNLGMSFLAEASDSDIVGVLNLLVEKYRSWIEEQREKVDGKGSDIDTALRPVANHHIAAADEAATRVAAGISLLEADPIAMTAFRLMNRAMHMQRARQDWVRAGADGDGPDLKSKQEWRPFQIGFVLLNLPGLSDPHHSERDIADLLWFPTGGGKTEAYLGLIAYTVLLRRLRDASASGVAVIMRYTLRLLTIQQFERAAMLVCSLEDLRRHSLDHGCDLGNRQFSIGLWVGSGATPNSADEAQRALRKLSRGESVEEGNPIQLLRCPWCGRDLGPDEYMIVRENGDKTMRIACRNSACSFGLGLPVHLIDEDVYRARPELVIGTVDKFARMAWSDQVRNLFARDGLGQRPDLVIQDELHLISGPLGSMVGLYETAVDAACAIDPGDPFAEPNSRPKVIASTATIRRAREQVKAVFDRTAAQFPPPGLDPDDSFFARPAPGHELGTREYVGVMAPGTSHQTVMIRVYASLLQSGQDVQADAETKDPYWTLLGYFSSLRVLGSAYLQVQDDVRTRLGVLGGRAGTPPRVVHGPSELTSRVGSREIPERLQGLENTFVEGNAEDVVLATNMISVGLDVDRLGLMAVMGQPQSSAEYIQATSRVGRRHPGLVVAILNSARSRDRSHYENFVPFHQSIYRAVEATSATPFAARARDRGLHGVLTAVARQLFDGLAKDNDAQYANGQEEKLERAARIIVKRATSVSDEGSSTDDQVQELIEVWLRAARERPGLHYRNKNNPDGALLIDPSDALVDPDIGYDQLDVPWPTLQSLRDVDAESGLYEIPMRWTR